MNFRRKQNTLFLKQNSSWATQKWHIVDDLIKNVKEHALSQLAISHTGDDFLQKKCNTAFFHRKVINF